MNQPTDQILAIYLTRDVTNAFLKHSGHSRKNNTPPIPEKQKSYIINLGKLGKNALNNLQKDVWTRDHICTPPTLRSAIKSNNELRLQSYPI